MSRSPGDPGRVIPFERCFNFRDLGGYIGLDGRRVRWRRLFRSMTPEYMTEQDVAIARGLGITTVIDLRGPQFASSGPLAEAPVRRVTVGSRRAFRRSQRALQEFRAAPPEVTLPLLLERMAPGFRRAVSLIAHAGGGVLVHCRLGKDRTGVLSALLLKLLGVSDAVVIEDYMASAPTAAAALQLVRAAEAARLNGQLPPESRTSGEPPRVEAITAVLQRLDDYGGAYAYFAQHGASPRTLDRLIEGLLE